MDDNSTEHNIPNSFGSIGLVLSILGYFIWGTVLGAVGAVLGIIGLINFNSGKTNKGRGISITAIVIGLAAIAIAISQFFYAKNNQTYSSPTVSTQNIAPNVTKNAAPSPTAIDYKLRPIATVPNSPTSPYSKRYDDFVSGGTIKMPLKDGTIYLALYPSAENYTPSNPHPDWTTSYDTSMFKGPISINNVVGYYTPIKTGESDFIMTNNKTGQKLSVHVIVI